MAFFAGNQMPPDRIQVRGGSQSTALAVLIPRHATRYCRHKSQEEFFMTRSALGDALSAVIVRWFELLPKVVEPVQLALSTMASSDLWVHVRFLSLMQALEGLHRALYPGIYMDEIE